MKGVGTGTLAKLRDLDSRDGWMYADAWFALHGGCGNRMPTLLSLGLVESFSLCQLGDGDLKLGFARCAYRLPPNG